MMHLKQYRNIVILLFIFFNLNAYSQSSNIAHSINLPKTIVVQYSETFGLYSSYVVRPKNTLYSICKAFNTNLDQLKDANTHLDLSSINPLDTLTIPFNKSILTSTSESFDPGQHIPVYYQTRPKDNLFRISKIYFNQEVDHLMKRNKMKNHDLQPNQLILVGWKAKSNIAQTQTPTIIEDPKKEENAFVPPPTREEVEKPGPEINKSEEKAIFIKKIELDGPLNSISKDSLIIVDEVDEIVLSESGLAIWNKESRASGKFALHSQAKVGSQIEITNPQLNRKEYIKVLGKIPGNSYPSNVKIILSPEAAKALGALDSRFYVKMNFIQG